MSKTQRELKALRQSQREEALRRQQAKDRRSLMIIAGSILAAGLLIAGVAIYLHNQETKSSANRLTFQAVTGVAGTQIPDEGPRNHIDPSITPTYKFYPPTSGQHYGTPDGPAPWQTTDQTLREGTFVHNMEHGGVVILYNCPSGAACDTLKSQLSNYVNNLAPVEPQFGEVKMLMTPYSKGMTKKVALVAWNWIEFLDGYDQAEITRFYEIHVDKGPEQIG